MGVFGVADSPLILCARDGWRVPQNRRDRRIGMAGGDIRLTVEAQHQVFVKPPLQAPAPTSRTQTG